MKRPTPADDWPESWKLGYIYDLQEIYGEVSDRGYTYAYEQRAEETLRMIRSVVQPPATILDVAAAQGNFSLKLAELGYRVTWNDLREDLADYVRLKYDTGEITYAPGNAFDLGFDSCFDLVLITEIIEHVAHPDEFLSKVRALVKPGGFVVMTTPNGGYFLNGLPRFSECPDPSIFEAGQFKPNADGHIFLLHEDEVTTLAAKAGLTVEECRLFANPVTKGHLKTRYLLNTFPRPCVTALENLTGMLPRAVQRRVLVSLGAVLRRPLNAS